MKLLILLALITGCSSKTVVISCGSASGVEHLEVFAPARSGEGVIKRIAFINDQCGRLQYEQSLNNDYIQIKAAATVRG